MGLQRTLARNTSFNILGRCLEALLGLVLIRYMWARITPAEYGLWSLIGAFTGYVALLDFGVGSAYAKFIAGHAAKDDNDAVSRVVTTGLLFYLGLSAVLLAITWPLIPRALSFGMDHGWFTLSDPGEIIRLLRWTVALYALSTCIGPFSAVQSGLQRMDIVNILGFGSSIVRLIATVVFLEMGLALQGLIYASLTTLLVFGIVSAWSSKRLLPSLRVSPRYIDRATFASLFSFGWRTQVARLSNLIMFETDKIVVGVLFGRLDLVGRYDLGVNLANKVRQVPALIFSALLPAAAELDAVGDDTRLRALYLRSTKYVAVTTIPLLLFTVATADLLMRVWMGEGFEQAAWVLRIIALGYIANILPGAGVSIALGKGRADLQMNAGLISMGVNIALTVGLYLLIGFWGIPIATSVSMLVSTAWFFWAVESEIGLGKRRLVREAFLWPSVATAPGFVLCVVIDQAAIVHASFWSAAAALLVAGTAFSALFLLVLRATPFLDAVDRDFLARTLRLKHVPGYRWWAGE